MLKGHVFKRQRFGNHIFALFMNTFLDGHNGIVKEYKDSMKLSYNGSDVTISSGAVCVQGRFLEEDSSTTLDAGTNTLFCKLVIEIDLSKDNTENEFNQASYKILVGELNYPAVTQQDIVKNNTGLYQYELATFKTGLSGISNFVDKRSFLDFDSIYTELEKQSNLATKDVVSYLSAGLMSVADKRKLDGIEAGAQVNSITGVKGSNESNYRTGNVNLTASDVGAASAWHEHDSLKDYVQTKTLQPDANAVHSLGSPGRLYKEVFTKRVTLPYTNIHDKDISSVFGVYEQLTVRAVDDDTEWRPVSASAFNEFSSRRYKKNIEGMTEEEANKLDDIGIVVFDYKNEKNGVGCAGVIAEEVYEILPNVVSLTNLDGEMVPDSVSYSKFVPYLIKKVQMLEKRVAELEKVKDGE